MDSTDRVFTLDEVDPAFSRYLEEMKPNRSMITVSCAPEHREKVASACGKLFREAVIPLFSEEDQESSPSR